MAAPAYHGIVVPLVTPLSDGDSLDEAGLERLIEHVLAGGVQGLFLLGTTGEGPSLSYRLRGELIQRTCRQVRGRVPVLVGITDTAMYESLRVARWAAEAGADAVVVAPPYYLPEAQPELQEYLEHLVPGLPLPVFLYNMPALTKVQFGLETIRYAMDQPRILGIKDSSSSMIYLHRLLALLPQRPDWLVLVGPEEMLSDALLAGAHGGVPGGANLYPQLYTALFNAARSGDLARVRELHAVVMRISEALYRIGRHPSAVIKGIKGALALSDICDDVMAEPFRRFREPERIRVRQVLDDLRGLLEGLGHLGPSSAA